MLINISDQQIEDFVTRCGIIIFLGARIIISLWLLFASNIGIYPIAICLIILMFPPSSNKVSVNKAEITNNNTCREIKIDHAVITGDTAAKAINEHILGIDKRQRLLSMIKDNNLDGSSLQKLSDLVDTFYGSLHKCYKEKKTSIYENGKLRIETQTEEQYQNACKKRDEAWKHIEEYVNEIFD